MGLKYETIINGPFQENCFLVWDESTLDGIIIDPGDEGQKIIRAANFQNLKIKGIYNTHAHIDHAGAVAEVKKELQVPFALHGDDEFLLDGMPAQAQMFGLPPMEVPKNDIKLAHGDTFLVGSHECNVRHTPGHTPGGVCFLFGDVVFVGDTLFHGSVGRTDLPGGSSNQLIASIKEQLMTLDDDVKALSGHGPITSIGFERKNNPFLNSGSWY